MNGDVNIPAYKYPSASWRSFDAESSSLNQLPCAKISCCYCENIPSKSEWIYAPEASSKLSSNCDFDTLDYVGLGSGNMGPDELFIKLFSQIEKIKKIAVILIDSEYKKDFFQYYPISQLLSTMRWLPIEAFDLVLYSSLDDYLKDVSEKESPRPRVVTCVDTHGHIPIEKVEKVMHQRGLVVHMEGVERDHFKKGFFDATRSDRPKYYRIELLP